MRMHLTLTHSRHCHYYRHSFSCASIATPHHPRAHPSPTIVYHQSAQIALLEESMTMGLPHAGCQVCTCVCACVLFLLSCTFTCPPTHFLARLRASLQLQLMYTSECVWWIATAPKFLTINARTHTAGRHLPCSRERFDGSGQEEGTELLPKIRRYAHATVHFSLYRNMLYILYIYI